MLFFRYPQTRLPSIHLFCYVYTFSPKPSLLKRHILVYRFVIDISKHFSYIFLVQLKKCKSITLIHIMVWSKYVYSDLWWWFLTTRWLYSKQLLIKYILFLIEKCICLYYVSLQIKSDFRKKGLISKYFSSIVLLKLVFLILKIHKN